MFDRFLLPLMACAILAVPAFATDVPHSDRAPAAVATTARGGHDKKIAFDARSAERTNASVTQSRVILADIDDYDYM